VLLGLFLELRGASVVRLCAGPAGFNYTAVSLIPAAAS